MRTLCGVHLFPWQPDLSGLQSIIMCCAGGFILCRNWDNFLKLMMLMFTCSLVSILLGLLHLSCSGLKFGKCPLDVFCQTRSFVYDCGQRVCKLCCNFFLFRVLSYDTSKLRETYCFPILPIHLAIYTQTCLLSVSATRNIRNRSCFKQTILNILIL